MTSLGRAVLVAALASTLSACGGGSGGDKDTSAPAVPGGLVAVASTGQVALQWTAVTDADLAHYDVYAGTASGALTKISQVTTPSFTVTALTNGTQYFFAVTAVDATGNASARSAEAVATPVLPDTTAPLLSSHSPATSETGVLVGAGLVLVFNENMSTSSVTVTTAPAFDLGTPSWSGQAQVSFNPPGPYAFNTSYTVTVDGTDTAGNPLGGTRTFSFTTENPPDSTPPTVVSFNPASGAVNQPAGVNLTFTFSEAMNRASVEGALVLSPAASTCLWSWSSDSTYAQCDLTANLAYGTTYTVTLGTGAKDPANNALAAATTFSFTTQAAPDTTPPTIASSSPANAATGAYPETNISVTFSEPMDQAVTQAAFQITSPAGQNGGVFSWSADGLTLTYDVPANIANGTLVTWQMGSGARDLAGNILGATSTNTFRVAYTKTVTINSDAAFDGGMLATGAMDQAGLTMTIGDNTANTQSKGWVSFPHTTLSPVPSRITSANFSFFHSRVVGVPYSVLRQCWPGPFLGCRLCKLGADCFDYLLARHVDVGATLTPAAFSGTVLSSVQISNSATNAYTTLTVPVTSQVIADRAASRVRTQFRLEFPVATNSDAVEDSIWIITANYAGYEPKLVVTYEYP